MKILGHFFILLGLLFTSVSFCGASWESLVAAFKKPYGENSRKFIEGALERCSKKRVVRLLFLKDPDDDNCTVLHKAASAGDAKLLSLLLKSCPKKNMYDYVCLQNGFGMPALHLADGQCFDILMEACPKHKVYDYMGMCNFEEDTIMHINPSCAIKYLNTFSQKKRWELLSKRGCYGYTPLHSCLDSQLPLNKKLKVVKGLLGACPKDKVFDYLSRYDDYGNRTLHFCKGFTKAPFISVMLSFCSAEARYDLLLQRSVPMTPYGGRIIPLSFAINFFVLDESFASVGIFLQAHQKVFFDGVVRYDWVCNGLNELLFCYCCCKGCGLYIQIKKRIKKAICNIVALSLYGFKSFDGSKRRSILLKHKQQLDAYIGALIDGKQSNVPQSIINYYNALMGNLSSEEEDTLNCKNLYDKSFCDTPYGISRSVKHALAKKAFSNMRKTKDITYMNKNLKKIMQGKIEKNAVAPDVEFVFG